ncbi:MAG: hypothetical protein PF484_01235 [Bacteroidales bacterium]|jgi:hypothetical protein|nr:hypothetical protein [Bacteroidales bacterium]
MKKKLVFVSVLFIVAMLQFSFNDKSVSGFNVANGWSWDSEFFSPSAPAQISYSGYCETRECTEWSDEGSFGYVYNGEVFCLHWLVTRDYGTWCTDNYVLTSGSCQGEGAPC